MINEKHAQIEAYKFTLMPRARFQNHSTQTQIAAYELPLLSQTCLINKTQAQIVACNLTLLSQTCCDQQNTGL